MVCVAVDVVTVGEPFPTGPTVLVMVIVGETTTVLVDVTVGVGRSIQLHALVTSRVGNWGDAGRDGRDVNWWKQLSLEQRGDGIARAAGDSSVIA